MERLKLNQLINKLKLPVGEPAGSFFMASLLIKPLDEGKICITKVLNHCLNVMYLLL